MFPAAFLINGCSKKSNPNPAASVPLKITGLSVTQGGFNTNVTIAGTGFSNTTSNHIVAFNGKTATVSSATSTTIVAVVPVGAGTGNVTITVNGTLATGPVFSYLLTGTVTTLAGNESPGSNDGTGISASFNQPVALAVDAAGNVYVADEGNELIRKITPAGVVTTLAGSGSMGSANGTGSAASFKYPRGIAVDASGNVYVADTGNALVRKITPGGVVSTFSATGSSGMTIDPNGNLFVCVGTGIQEITPAGVVSSVFAPFTDPLFLAYQNGTLYVSDWGKQAVGDVLSNGTANFLAGSGTAGFANGSGTAASFNYPSGLVVDQAGNIYVADTNNDLIRAISPGGVVTTLAGGAKGTFPEINGVGTAAGFYLPTGMAIDASGNLYVSDQDGDEIRKIVLK